MKLYAWCLSAVLAILIGGCANTPRRAADDEPPFVGVANLTAAPIQQVTVSKVGDSSQEGSFGSVSPVPIGAMQLFERRTYRPRLPSKVQLTWITAYGKTQTRVVPLREVLDAATGASNEALIIELRRDGSVVPVLKMLQ